MLEAMHWIGAIIGAIGFAFLAARTAFWRRIGFVLNTLACAILLTWATIVGAFGLFVLWVPILVSSVIGYWRNRRDV